MKLAWLTIVLLTCASAVYGYTEVQKEKEKKKFSLIEVFRDMASKVKQTFSSQKADKAFAVINIPITRNYDVRKYSIITSQRLDMVLGGVLKDKGEKLLSEARKNNICPIFFTAVAIHESNNGNSKCARERQNVFGIYDAKIKRHKYFKSVDECIEFSAKLLSSKSYAGGKLYTISAIQKKYCPTSAQNDPGHLNKYWLDGILSHMQRIWGSTIYVKA